MDTFLKILPSALIIGGWIIAYQLQALQARRKLLREEVEKARAAVDELVKSAIVFHTSTHSPADRLDIIASTTDVERRCEMFPKIVTARKSWLPDAVRPANAKVDAQMIVNLRQAITLEHFDDASASALPHDAEQLTLITNAGRDLISKIDDVLIAALD